MRRFLQWSVVSDSDQQTECINFDQKEPISYWALCGRREQLWLVSHSRLQHMSTLLWCILVEQQAICVTLESKQCNHARLIECSLPVREFDWSLTRIQNSWRGIAVDRYLNPADKWKSLTEN